MGLFGLFGPPDVEKLRAKKDVRALIKALGYDKDKKVPQRAAEALGALGATEALEPLVAALRSEDLWLRKIACDALGNLGDPSAVRSLTPLLEERDYQTQSAACDAIVKLGGDAALEVLTGLVRRRSTGGPLVQKAASALARAKARTAVPALLERLRAHAEDSFMNSDAVAVIGALGELGDDRAVPVLVRFLKHGMADYRSAAAKALVSLGHTPSKPRDRCLVALGAARWSELPELYDPLAGLLTNEPRLLTLSVLDGLASLPGADGDRLLVLVLKVGTELYRRRGAEALQKRGWLPRSDRERALAAIAKHRFREAASAGSEGLALLESLVRSKETPELRRGALDALAEGRGAELHALLVSSLADPPLRDVAARHLGPLENDAIIESKMPELALENATTRRQALEELLRRGWQPRTPREHGLAAYARNDWKWIEDHAAAVPELWERVRRYNAQLQANQEMMNDPAWEAWCALSPEEDNNWTSMGGGWEAFRRDYHAKNGA